MALIRFLARTDSKQGHVDATHEAQLQSIGAGSVEVCLPLPEAGTINEERHQAEGRVRKSEAKSDTGSERGLDAGGWQLAVARSIVLQKRRGIDQRDKHAARVRKPWVVIAPNELEAHGERQRGCLKVPGPVFAHCSISSMPELEAAEQSRMRR